MIFIKLNLYQIGAGAGVCVCGGCFRIHSIGGDKVTLQLQIMPVF